MRRADRLTNDPNLRRTPLPYNSEAERQGEPAVLRAAREYVQRGWAPVPLKSHDKAPIGKDWPRLRLTDEGLAASFAGGRNIGILTGRASGGLVDVDCDAPEAVAAALLFLPLTGMIHGRPGIPASHYWYMVSELAPTTPGQNGSAIRSLGRVSFQFDALDAREKKTSTMLVELRSDRLQTMVPPSIHPSGEQLHWERYGEPGRVSWDTLRQQVARVGACALLARYWPGVGSRDVAALALTGLLVRGGWPKEAADHFVAAVAQVAGDEEWRERGANGQLTAEKLAAGERVTGGPKLATLLRGDGARVVAQVREWLGLLGAAQASQDEPQDEDALSSLSSFTSYGLEPYPAPLAEVGWYGVAGELVRALAPHTEADPHALLFQLLVAFGNAAGRHANVLAEGDRHYTNLFLCLVGPTAGGRKGTSWGHVRTLQERVDPEWVAKRVVGGLSSGEGLIHHLRDGTPALTGVVDKRLLAYQPEFASVLKVLLREGNQLADILKQAWDGQVLQVVTKQQPERASGALVSIIGHITKDELLRYLSETEAASGFGNRFLWVCVRRAQYLPEGGDLGQVQDRLGPLVERLAAALTYAGTAGGMARDEAARALWAATYRGLAEGRPGLLGALTARAEAQVLRLALIEALLDQSQVIAAPHLQAALALWDYALASARYVFGARLGDPTADAILHALRATPAGLTREDIIHLFQRNKPAAELARALGRLQELGLVRVEVERTGGRPAERWYALVSGTK